VALSVTGRSPLALAAGVLVAASLPPWGFWPLAFVGVALLAHLVLAESSATGAATVAFIFCLGWYAPAMGWMWHLTPPGYVAATTIFAALHAAAAAAATRSRSRPVAAVAAHALVETIRFSAPFGGVPLASLAISQATSPLAPLARVVGPIGITAVVFGIGFALAATPRTRGLATVAALVAFSLVAPALSPRGGESDATLRVAGVQGGGEQGTLAIETSPREVFERHLAATALVPDDVDLVVWPENVVSVRDFATSRERDELAAESARLGVPFVVGITERVGDDAFTNAQVVLAPDGSIGDRYDKVKRVPFGEYMPLRSLLRALGAPVDRVPRDAVAGRTSAALRAADVTLGVAISWEVFFPSRTAEGVNEGATIVLNPTNGASYTGTILQGQQISASRLRAIETGRWIVQVSPTGYSAFVSPDGEVSQRTGVGERAVIVADVPLREGRTPYSRVGDTPVIVALLALFALSARRRLPRGRLD